ncbi:hypothetical protein NLX67_07880 [Domibacillus sp. A3M-37]|nr:hypothetical protein [Domibacillus sp. A3M-37]MCP3762307.1 hypothetical protein [Domibacillus sp. A3M-37]
MGTCSAGDSAETGPLRMPHSFFANKSQPKNGVKQKGRRLLREQRWT